MRGRSNRDSRYAGYADPKDEEEQRRVLRSARDVLEQEGISITAFGPVGDPADEILVAARSFEAELIVVGARSLGTVKRLVLGSVSTKVMHDANCDVLIVKYSTMNAIEPTDLDIFDRIVCGIDGTPESLFAVKQAARLQRAGGSLLLVAAVSLAKAAHAGMAAPHAAELLQTEAEQAMAEAKAVVAAEGKIVDGDPAAVLLNEAQRATLLALGSHGRKRAAGILLGTVAARMLHEAACSVLIARPARDPDTWPRAIVVGVDGSPESELAVASARLLAKSSGADLRIVSATSDQVDRDAARRVAPELEEREGRGLGVLKAESETADLVVVGSRGLQGLKALGSVSERIAHQASCSVLVVRGATPG